MTRNVKIPEKAKQKHSDGLTLKSEQMTVDEKLKILQEIGKPELIDLFKEWRPKTPRKKRAAPLDQRVSIAVTASERKYLEDEIARVKAVGEKITASQYIRNKATGNVDINGWKTTAIKALEELDSTLSDKKELETRKKELVVFIESTTDKEDEIMWQRELDAIEARLGKLLAKNEKRTGRLTGRMSMAESETVKWRAQRLCLSASDYLRMVLFELEPNSTSDAHLSLDGKRRFYISIIDVANNGWGNPPTVYECSQCGNYLEEIERLKDRVKQLESFV